MSNNVIVHFKCEGHKYSLMFKDSTVEEITLAMIEGRIYKKLVLDESKVKLQLSYIPLLVGCEEEWTIFDDDDLCVYLMSIDKENRRCILYVEVMSKSKVPDNVSRSRKSSFGMNYEELHSNEVEIGANDFTLVVDNEQAKQQEDAIEDDDDDTRDEPPQFIECNQIIESGHLIESSQFIEAWEDGLGLSVRQEFSNKKALQELVDRAAFLNCFGYAIKWSDKSRYVVKCLQERCKWGLRAVRVRETDIFSIRTYTKMHTCSRASQSTSNLKRKGNAGLVSSLLNEDYPGQLETPRPKIIMDLVKRKFGVKISYSTALRGKNEAIHKLRGSPEESYKMLYCYLYMLEEVNPRTITSVKLDEKGKFKYLFIALGCCIEGFKVMRKVIIVDATFLKNGYGGVLVFASAQDPNRHHYPIAFGVIDGENNDSWNWFFEMLKIVVQDSSELVFVSDRNASLISAIGNVYPQAHHGYCIWHLSQNVKGHASNVNKDVVAWRFMECSRLYTVAEFSCAYSSFKARYDSAAKYLENSTVKEKWARSCFPGDRYNIDTSNCVESLNSVFKDARKYSLIPMLDTIIKKISDWFNAHRKDAASGAIDNKLVPLVENYLHDLWAVAEKLNVMELNSFEREYNVTGSDGKPYLVNLLMKRCSCRFFDIEKYPCLHALAAFIECRRHISLELHDLCSKFYWTELWALAYYNTIYLVPDRSEWNVPDYVKEVQILPPDCRKKGQNKNYKVSIYWRTASKDTK